MVTRSIGFTLAAIVLASGALAQCPQYTPIFHGGGFDDDPYDLVRFDDGSGEKLYVGGAFTIAGASQAAHMAAWDGTSWKPVGGGTNNTVRALAAHDDGSGPALYAGGVFTQAGGQNATRVARWNGASWSALGAGVDGAVNVLVSFDDGSGPKLYAAGTFTHAGGAPVNRVARWNGASWSQVGAGLDAEARALAVHDDETGPKLYAGGAFAGWIARWDGASWQTIGTQLGPVPETYALTSYDAGPGARWLIAGGRQFMGSNAGVVRWDGATWQSIASLGGTSRVHDLEVRQEASELALYASGGIDINFVARWTPSTAFTSTGASFSGGIVRTLGLYDDQTGHGEELYIGGQFLLINCATSNPVDAHRVARFDGSTWRGVQVAPHSFWAPCAIGFPDASFPYPELRALARWRDPSDGRFKVVAGGWLFGAGDDPSIQGAGLAVWDGLKWSRFPGTYCGFVDALTTWTDPITSRDVLVAGAGGGCVAKYDGTAWSPLSGAAPQDVQVFASFQEPGASFAALFAGSEYTNQHIKRWDGVSWTYVGSGLPGSCEALIVFDPPGSLGPGLYAAGAFGTRRWDGTQWSIVSAGGALHSLAVFDDGAGPMLYAGGDQALWRFNGTSWTSYATNDPLDARTLEVFDDGTGPALYMQSGKRFRNGQIQTYAAGGPSAYYMDMLAFEDENGGQKALWFAGEFDVAGNVPSRGIARWSNPCATLATYCTAKINSQGCTPTIGWSGEPSVSLSATTPFTITASNVINQKGGLLYFGAAGRSAVPFQGGFKCVRFPALRTPPRSSGGNVGPDDCSGLYSIDFTPWLAGSNNELLDIGVTVDAQWWSRDPASPTTTGLTNAIEFEIRP